MWKEVLPDKCPTDKAVDLECDVYRITKSNTPCDNDFIIYAKLYPQNDRYKHVCKAYAISFYNTLENAKSYCKFYSSRGSNRKPHC